MKSTVVIPNYNGIKFLGNCLNSLLECRPFDFNIIVVDNGSTDGSKELLLEKYKDVKLISFEDNKGFASAVNAGIDAAQTDYVILLNNDTTVAVDFVYQLEKALDLDERVFSASAKMVDMYKPEIIDGAGDYYSALGWAYAYGKGKSTVDDCLETKRIFSACGGAAIYRRSVLIEIGKFDDLHFAYLEDVDVGYRARIAGFYNIYAPLSICYHAGSASSGSRYNEFKINLSSRNSIYIVLKNMPVLQLIINLPFLMIGFMVKALFFFLKGYGKIYIRGLGKGFSLFFSSEGRKKKVKFKLRNLRSYIVIQMELWINMIRRLWA